MERSEKRKIDDILDDDDEHGKNTKVKNKKILDIENIDEGDKIVAPAVEEHQVEEFYAILRRMQVALKYFHDKRGNSEEGWRIALEREVAEDTAAETEAAEVENAVLDLNAAPHDEPVVPES